MEIIIGIAVKGEIKMLKGKNVSIGKENVTITDENIKKKRVKILLQLSKEPSLPLQSFRT